MAPREDPSRVAFLLVRAPNEDGKHRYLLQKRADDANHGGTWGLPGGKCHVGENPWDAAVRESREELGELPDMQPAAHWERDDDGKAVHTFLVSLAGMFSPTVDGKTADETAGWGWFKRKHVADLPLHPAFRETWDGIDWDDKALAKALMTPAQYQIQQIAYESAVQLANHLGASVNSGQVAQQWLNRYAHKRKPRRSKANRKPRQRPAPRRYLNTAGATAAISAALTAVLIELWAAAWIAGMSVAAFLLGLGALGVYDDALAALEAEGKRRVEDMVQTRASRLERVLMEALSEGWDADRLAEEIQAILGSQASALLVTVTEAQWASQQALLRVFQQAGVTHVRWNTRRDGKVCQRCLTAQAAGPWPIGKPFPGANVPAPGAHPRCRCWLTVAAAPKAAKSAETPIVSTVHHPLGHEGLWHTPDRHVATMQQLPAYVQNTARAIAREHGGTPEAAIPMAIAAVKAWAAGHAFGGRVKVTAEVQQAAQDALDEWEQLKASHH